ncbi:MAG: Crp/Fnr family transcriptional regulator [Variibacter sp.]|nr:Crp/Fnr family transcriptional regulator [Variibacter sp.]
MSLDPAILRPMELFAGVDNQARAVIVGAGRTRRIARGRALFKRGDKAASCHALISGRVRIAQPVEGTGGVVIRYVGPGEMFGAVALFYDGRFPADATAVTDCVEIQWSAAAMMGLIERYPRIALNALRIVGRRLDELQDRLRELSTERVEQRVARTLSRLARQAGRKAERGGVEIAFPLTRKDLAAMTGTGHYTVSRLFSGWQEKGIVASARSRIIVRDQAALEAIASGRS